MKWLKSAALIIALLAVVFISLPVEHETIEVSCVIGVNDTIATMVSDRVTDKVDYREYVYLTRERTGVDPNVLQAGERQILVLPKGEYIPQPKDKTL